ncbi:Hint domain-containing protein [Rhodovulum sp. YNF3179]|uniref:Hint domain-containing protein n=1 Tax=Rhodovulum sp. YNF3179 TaxID=3425127 RepID=UPI003D356442
MAYQVLRSYKLVGAEADGHLGRSVAAVGAVPEGTKPGLLIGASGAGTTGTTYRIDLADLAALDAADGDEFDGLIRESDLPSITLTATYSFVGPDAEWTGYQAVGIGDVDGDGFDELLIAASESSPDAGAVYLVSSRDLEALDTHGGVARDQVIDLGSVAAYTESGDGRSYRIVTSIADTNELGQSLSYIGDFDDDGRADLLMTSWHQYNRDEGGERVGYGGSAYLISGAELEALDEAGSADGATRDGEVDLADIEGFTGNSVQFRDVPQHNTPVEAVSGTGDVDGDGRPDILIGAQSYNSDYPGHAFLVTGADLEDLDNVYGPDGVLSLARMDQLPDGATSYHFIGAGPGDQSGYDVSIVGDLDNDGRDDLLIAAYVGGKVYVVSGADLEGLANADREINLAGIATGSGSFEIDTAGEVTVTAVTDIGDVDGDGHDDIAFGGIFGAGRTYVLGGADLVAADDLDNSRDGKIDATLIPQLQVAGHLGYLFQGASSSYAGISAPAGDLDGDGRADLLIGAYREDVEDISGYDAAGATYAIMAADFAAADDVGDGTGQDGIIALDAIHYDGIVQGTAGDDQIDTAYLADPGLDRLDRFDALDNSNDDEIEAGDGDDTIVASAGDDDIDGGAGHDTYRAADDALMGYRLIGDRSTGYSLAQTGDMNGDGLDDLLIGARWAGVTDSGAFQQDGRTYLVTGAALEQATPVADTAGVIDLDTIAGVEGAYTFKGATLQDLSGAAVASLGDLDGDGNRELLIGAPNAGAFSAGKAYLVASGSFAAADTDGDGVIDLGDVAGTGLSFQFDANSGNILGRSIASAGDVDGDGFEDLIVGAPIATYDPTPGSAYLVTAQYLRDHHDSVGDGVIDLPDAADEADIYRIEGAADASTGWVVAPAGNVVGDGRADLMIWSPGNGDQLAPVHLLGAEAFDGVAADGVIELDPIASLANSYRFQGFAHTVSDAHQIPMTTGDADGDGQTDLLIGPHLVSGADLAGLDADGDQVIARSDIAGSQGSFSLTLGFPYPDLGVSTAFVDALGDDRQELLIGFSDAAGLRSSGTVYLVSHDDLVAAADADRQVDLTTILSPGSSYRFIGDVLDRVGNAVSSVGDVDGDGREDLIIGASRAEWEGHDTEGEAYLIRSSDLAHLDAADDIADGTIDLDHVGMLAEQTLDVTIYDDATGTAIKGGTGYPGTDTLTNVEHYVADKGAGHDRITLNNTAAQVLFDRDVDVSDLDGAIGTFDPGNGGADIAFGGAGEPTLPEILAGIQAGDPGYAAGGRFTITSGDESGQVGNISFENFETIDFGIVCFAAGTLIDTPAGPRPVEQIAAGDAVLTRDRGAQPVRWSGARRVSAAAQIANPRTRPIRIRAGALGPGVPARDLRVSRQHRILLADPDTGNEVLLAAIKLVGRPGITRDDSCTPVAYHHLLCPRHEILSAHGVPAESLLLGPQARKMLTPAQWAQISRDCADLVARPGPAARPIVRRAAAALTVPRSTAAKAEGLRRRTRHENPAPHFARPPVSTADVPGARETETAPPPF